MVAPRIGGAVIAARATLLASPGAATKQSQQRKEDHESRKAVASNLIRADGGIQQGNDPFVVEISRVKHRPDSGDRLQEQRSDGWVMRKAKW
jgi:hypothetical protein